MVDYERKAPYKPTEKRRFEISQDPYSRERLKGLLTTHRALKQELPFYAGMTMYGSLSMGKILTPDTAPITDMDVFTFVDNDRYEATIAEFEKTEAFQRYIKTDKEYLGRIKLGEPKSHEWEVRIAIPYYIRKRVRDIMHGSMKLSPNIDLEIEANTRFISVEGKKYTLLGCAAGENPLEGDLVLASAFFYDIGGGLRKYREAFLKQLLSLPQDVGEKYWQTAVEAMRMWEREDEIPESISYTFPTTLAEVAKYYTTGGRKTVAPESPSE